jgi:recombination protein RecA
MKKPQTRVGKAKVAARETRSAPSTPPAPDGLDAAVSKVVGFVQKKLGAGALMRLGDEGAYPEITHVVPTGLPSLDRVFGTSVNGVFGMPLGKLICIEGKESSGKTTLTKHLAARCQLVQVVPNVVDTEQSGVLAYDEGLGVRAMAATASQPDTMEEVFALIYTTTEAMEAAHVMGCTFFDSVAATPTADELEKGFDDGGGFPARAKYLSNNLPKLVKGLKSGRVGLVFVNQLRQKIGALPYQKQTYAPGGMALKHWAHVILEATKTRIKATKNKLAPPLREAVLEIRFDPPRILEEGAEARPKRTPVHL